MPLTKALASQGEGGATFAAPSTPLPSFPRNLPPAWDEAGASPGEPLVAAFLFLVRELADLNSRLQSHQELAWDDHRHFLPRRVPGPTHLVHALREARESLRDLKGLLSHP